MFRKIINSSSCRSKQFKLILNNRQQLKKSSIRPKSNLSKSVTNFSPILRQNSKICTTSFRKDENKQRIEEIDAENVCKLDDGTPIFIVDDKTAFNDLIEFITNCTKNNEEIIGIDSEWGPYFVAKSEERMSILQIATSDAVYIVDIQRLNEENVIAEEEWINLFQTLFCNEATKIGYDFKNDLRMLEKTFPCALKIFKKSKNILCLFRLFQQISHIPNASEIIFGPNPPEKLGLSCVVKHFLNIQLKKKIRMSNWHSRPLRIEQKKYAAMDAHILIKLYHRIQLDFKRLNADQQLSLQKNAFVKMVGRKKSSRQK